MFVLLAVVQLRAFGAIGGWGVLQVISLGLASQDDDIADMAHVGDFLTAALLFYSFRPAGACPRTSRLNR